VKTNVFDGMRNKETALQNKGMHFCTNLFFLGSSFSGNAHSLISIKKLRSRDRYDRARLPDSAYAKVIKLLVNNTAAH